MNEWAPVLHFVSSSDWNHLIFIHKFPLGEILWVLGFLT